jgi:hypothetical protein
VRGDQLSRVLRLMTLLEGKVGRPFKGTMTQLAQQCLPAGQNANAMGQSCAGFTTESQREPIERGASVVGFDGHKKLPYGQPLREDPLSAIGGIAKEASCMQLNVDGDTVPGKISQFALIVAMNPYREAMALGAGRLHPTRTNNRGHALGIRLEILQLKFGSVRQRRAVPHRDNGASQSS